MKSSTGHTEVSGEAFFQKHLETLSFQKKIHLNRRLFSIRRVIVKYFRQKQSGRTGPNTGTIPLMGRWVSRHSVEYIPC
ncbi:hypothetical protein LV478_12770 [Komagataeibacter oboediens]|uniref:hypothetical protein n=1 Tax=Komagataeibacter oboediens TaxID=65958 RepID=UPI0023DAE1FB|nr:hypothetical protein [Komagataeibacter oboediens]WEQ51394.1 hypothetical protein LV478_12770 [Komagataeibacter oboediens]